MTHALDLVQDTYLKAITYKDKFVDYTNLKAWVFTIMKNTFINNYRRNVKENTIIDGTQDLYYINQPHDKGFISPESIYSEGEIEKAIDSLDDEFKIPFRMHIEGYKYKEIADELGSEDRNSKKQDILYPSEVDAYVKGLRQVVLIFR